MDRTARFGRARTRTGADEQKKVTFEDVAGAEEEKGSSRRLWSSSGTPKRFLELGARIPKGVLLVARRAPARPCWPRPWPARRGFTSSPSPAPTLWSSTWAWASRVRDLFDQAKKNAPAIVFIDGIDAVAASASAGLGGGHDEREQTLNQLLVEMDGFGNNEGRGGHGGHQPAGHPGSRPPAPRPLRPAGIRGTPRHQGPGGHPEGPCPQQAPGDDVSLAELAKRAPAASPAPIWRT